MEFIADLFSYTVSSMHFKEYEEKIINAYKQRELLKESERLKNLALSGDELED